MATYKKLTKDGSKVQVESAIRDGDGKNIANNYVKHNSYDETLSVGKADLADNLTPYSENSGATDTSPFVFQSSGGSSDIGSLAYLKALRGNTVAFNQLVQNGNFESTSGWAGVRGTISANNNVLSYTITELGTSTATNRLTKSVSLKANHKYLCLVSIKAGHNTTFNFSLYASSVQNTYGEMDFVANTRTKNGVILEPTEDITMFYISCGLSDYGFSVNDVIEFSDVMIIDLTQLGKNYTSVVCFNRDYPLPYYAYNAGTLLSCKVNGYKTVGYNAFDGELETGYISSSGVETASNQYARSKNFIPVIIGEKYTFEKADDLTITNWGLYIACYDGNKNWIKNVQKYGQTSEQVQLDNNTRYIRVFASYGSNISTKLDSIKWCIHLTWDGTRTGYEPYETKTYPMPNVELKSACSVYDELKPDGTKITRIGSYTFTGEETWTSEASQYYCSLPIADADRIKGAGSSSNIGNIICAHLTTSAQIDLYNGTVDNGIAVGNALFTKVVAIRSSSNVTSTATAASFMAGKTIYYELATPTESEDLGYQEITPIDDWGTQEFLYDNDITIPVPQGNEFFYPVDYKAFIDSVGGRDDVEYDAGQLVSLTQLNNFLKTITGYDATKTQSLKNVSGTIQWVTEE